MSADLHAVQRTRTVRASAAHKRTSHRASTVGVTVLDHLALAVRDWSAGEATLASCLGGRWRYGLATPSFNPCQIAYLNDTRIELLAPPDDGNSFVTKFLEANDDKTKPHHITFLTDDLPAAIRRVEGQGIAPVLVSLDNPRWREAFLHPRDTQIGVLIQIAQTSIDIASSISDDLLIACPWPESELGGQASMEFITIAVQDPLRAADLFVKILGGEIVMTYDDSVVRLTWPAGADIILFVEDPATRRPGVRAVGMSVQTLPDLPAEPVGGGWHRTPVMPELGVQLLLNAS